MPNDCNGLRAFDYCKIFEVAKYGGVVRAFLLLPKQNIFVVVCCRLCVALVRSVARREMYNGATKLQGGAGTCNQSRRGRVRRGATKKPKNRDGNFKT